MKTINAVMKKYLFPLIAAALITLGLSGCGGSGQDTQKPQTEEEQSLSGVAVDGYLARATVFLDTNNNATRDPWERYAFTDDEGYYSYNPLTQIDYCATGATVELRQYCLRVRKIQSSSVVIRIDGGYDILTQEPFTGQLSRRVDVSNGVVPFVSITPLTSVFTDITDSASKTTMLTALGITEQDLDVDYLNQNGQVNTALLNIALSLHKVVAVLSDRLEDTYNKLGDDFGTPNDASALVYAALAKELNQGNNTNVDQALTDSDFLLRVLDAAETDVRAIYQDNDYALPPDMGNQQTPDKLTRIVEVATQIPDLVSRLVADSNPATMSTEEATGSTKALESVVVKILKETETNDQSIDNAIQFFNDANNDSLVDALKDNLQESNSDLSALFGHDFNLANIDTPEEIARLVTIPDTVVPFNQIGGLRLKVSDIDLGNLPNNLKDSEVEFYFEGNTTALSGKFSACAKYIDGANVDGTLGEGNTRGELIKGYWSLMGANENQRESFSLLLTIDFLATRYQAFIKPAEPITLNGNSVQQFRFDNNQEFVIWRSEAGMVPFSSIPTSGQECEQRLPSRIGI
jgi:hypothetical protein